MDPTFTLHGGTTGIHSRLDSNGPTHTHTSGMPTILLKCEQVAFSAYFSHFTQHSKCTVLDQMFFMSTNTEPRRCALEQNNLAHFPTGCGEGANLPDHTQELQHRPQAQLHCQQRPASRWETRLVPAKGRLLTVQGWRVTCGGFSSTC